jgi:polysaccharide biosynthesis protein PelE
MKIRYTLTLLTSLVGAIAIGYLLILSDSKSIWLFLSASTIINILVTLVCLHTIPKTLISQHKIALFFLLVLFASLIPSLGTFLLGIFAIILNRFYRTAKTETMRLAKTPKFIREKMLKSQTLDERKIREILTSESSSITEKINALTTINLETSSRANLINRALLSETADEIRLLAFSLLAKQENEINEQINHLLNKLKNTSNKIFAAKIHKHLALLYWKLIDFNLAQEDFVDFTINKSLAYANKALKEFPEDNALWVLLGKIYISQNDITKAYDALNRATRLHASDRKVLPYLAELSFKNKNYEEMKNYLFMNKSLHNIPALSPIINFWEKAT